VGLKGQKGIQLGLAGVAFLKEATTFVRLDLEFSVGRLEKARVPTSYCSLERIVKEGHIVEQFMKIYNRIRNFNLNVAMAGTHASSLAMPVNRRFFLS
jgi:hypothetical protein